MHCENSSYKQTPVIDIKTSAKLLNWFLLEFELFHKCKQHFCMLDFIKRCKCANACAGVQLQMWLRGRERESIEAHSHWSMATTSMQWESESNEKCSHLHFRSMSRCIPLRLSFFFRLTFSVVSKLKLMVYRLFNFEK